MIKVVKTVLIAPNKCGSKRSNPVHCIPSLQSKPPTITTTASRTLPFLYTTIVAELVATVTQQALCTLHLEAKVQVFLAQLGTRPHCIDLRHCLVESAEVTEFLTILVTADVSIGLGGMEYLCVVVLVIHKVDGARLFSLPVDLVLCDSRGGTTRTILNGCIQATLPLMTCLMGGQCAKNEVSHDIVATTNVSLDSSSSAVYKTCVSANHETICMLLEHACVMLYLGGTKCVQTHACRCKVQW